jgi:hypothetical protein
LRWARLAAFGAVRAAIAPADADGQLQIELRVTDQRLPPDTDTALCEAGFATLTTIVGIAESWPAELPIADVSQRPVPGAAFDPTHKVPDASDRHTLYSRDHA